jgi:microtubule-associated protein, RP/EB family
LLQALFDKVDIQHYIPVEKVIKGKYQDNLELLQWVYEVFNRNYTGAEYDPVKRRAKSKGGVAAHVAKKPGAISRAYNTATKSAP